MEKLLERLKESWPYPFDRIDWNRDMGSTSYVVYAGEIPYFLRVIKPALISTAVTGVQVQWFLQQRGFPVPAILPTAKGELYVEGKEDLLILYEFIPGQDVDPEEDSEAIGALVGQLHREMKDYPGRFICRDRDFYLGRYLRILEQKEYPNIDAYRTIAEALWQKVGSLPMGYCHGDLYRGNIRKGADKRLYIHDFDTSCWGFPMYDVTLICDLTDYFRFDEGNYSRSLALLARFLDKYRAENPLNQAEADAFPALIALQHFSTQATIMELFGLDCFSWEDMDGQLNWLEQWNRQWLA